MPSARHNFINNSATIFIKQIALICAIYFYTWPVHCALINCLPSWKCGPKVNWRPRSCHLGRARAHSELARIGHCWACRACKRRRTPPVGCHSDEDPPKPTAAAPVGRPLCGSFVETQVFVGTHGHHLALATVANLSSSAAA